MMCDLCGSGSFEEIQTVDVGRVAMIAQHVDHYGCFHLVVDDCNVEDENIIRCLESDECSPVERKFGELILGLSENQRISALAMAEGLWGVCAIKPA